MINIINSQIGDEVLDQTYYPDWKIENDKSADWVIETTAEEIADFDRVLNLIKEKIDFYQAKYDEATTKKQLKLDWRDAKLQQYFDTLPIESKKRTKTQESYELPTGKLVRRYQSPKFDHGEDLVRYLEEVHPAFVKWQKTSIWGEFKKQIKIVDGNVIDDETGEVVPVTITEQPPKFEVKI